MIELKPWGQIRQSMALNLSGELFKDTLVDKSWTGLEMLLDFSLDEGK